MFEYYDCTNGMMKKHSRKEALALLRKGYKICVVYII